MAGENSPKNNPNIEGAASGPLHPFAPGIQENSPEPDQWGTSSKAYNDRSLRNESGMVDGVSGGGRGRPDKDDQEDQRENRYKDAAFLMRLESINQELDALMRDYERLVEEVKILQEREDTAREELLLLQQKRAEIEGRIDHLQTHVLPDAEKTMVSLEQQAANINMEADKMFDQLSKHGLPEQVLKISHEEVPGECSPHDYDVAVTHDARTGEFSYVLPDGTIHKITQEHQINSLRQQLQDGKISADALGADEQARTRQYGEIAEKFRTLSLDTEEKQRAYLLAQKNYSDFVKTIQDGRDSLKAINEEIAAKELEIEALQKEKGDKIIEAGVKREQIDELRLQLAQLGIKRDDVEEKLASIDEGRLLELKNEAEAGLKNYNAANALMEEEFARAMEQMEKANKVLGAAEQDLTNNYVMTVPVVYDGVKQNFVVYRNDQYENYYVAPDGAKIPVDSEYVADQLSEGSVAPISDKINDPRVKKAIENIEEANKILVANKDKIGETNIASSALAERLDTHDMPPPKTAEEAKLGNILYEIESMSRVTGSIGTGRLQRIFENAPPEMHEKMHDYLHENNISTFDDSDNAYTQGHTISAAASIDPLDKPPYSLAFNTVATPAEKPGPAAAPLHDAPVVITAFANTQSG